MRDPAGWVDTSGEVVVRHLHEPLTAGHFLRGPVAAGMVASGRLTPYEIVSDHLLHSRKVPLVTYPYEWVHSQFVEAARLTLDIAEQALEAEQELKDASAYNVLFRAARSEFCDHTSFAPVSQPYWWAYGQFLRHFLMPLAVSKHCGLAPGDVFKTWRDGLAVEQATALLGPRRWVHRIGLACLKGSARAPGRGALRRPTRPVHRGVFQFLRWQLEPLARAVKRPSQWAGYEAERSHYSDAGMQCKRETIAGWLQRLRPACVLDLGCNQGEFSLIAAEQAQAVIALDADQASLERLRQRIEPRHSITTVWASLDEPSGGRGWCGTEQPGLLDRLHERADVTLVLALIHHLSIGGGIPMAEVAAMLARTTRGHLVVELLDTSDVKVQALMAARNRDDAARFDIEHQRAALDRHFVLREQVQLPDVPRWLLLLEKRPHAG